MCSDKKKRSIMFYILQGETPVPETDFQEWARWMATVDCIVKQTQLGSVRVSTAFIGFDHNWNHTGAPLLFETWLSGGIFGDKFERCATLGEAKEQHEKVVCIVSAAAELLH